MYGRIFRLVNGRSGKIEKDGTQHLYQTGKKDFLADILEQI